MCKEQVKTPEVKTLFIVHDDCSNDQAHESITDSFSVSSSAILNCYVDYHDHCSFGCNTPVPAPALSVQYSRSSLPVSHFLFPIPDFSYIQMKVLFAWVRILCISRIIVRKLALNSIHKSFEEGQTNNLLLPTVDFKRFPVVFR